MGSEGGRRDGVEGGLVGSGEFLKDLDAREIFPLSREPRDVDTMQGISL